jgi:YVTN family beta-propeller protein
MERNITKCLSRGSQSLCQLLPFLGTAFLLISSGSAQSPAVDSTDGYGGPKNIVVATIPMKTAFTAVVSPDSKLVYVGNYDQKTVSVIDAATNAITSIISMHDWVRDLAITPDGHTLYVECFGEYSDVVVVDTSSDRITSVLGDSQDPTSIAVSPDGKLLWELGGGSISIVDTATKQFRSWINTGRDIPYGVAFSPDGAGAFVLSSLVDLKANGYGLFLLNATSLPTSYPEWRHDKVSKSGKFAEGATVSPDGRTLYFTTGEEVVVFDTTQQQVQEKIWINGYGSSGQPAVTPDGKYLYVPYSDGFVFMINTATNRVSRPPITVGVAPDVVVIAPTGKYAYVVNGGVPGSVSVIDIRPQ